MTTNTQSFSCEICGKLFNTEKVAQFHETECKTKHSQQEEQDRIYKEKRANRLAAAQDISRNSKSIELLVEHELYEDARTLCRDHARWLWDCGTSSGWESLYTAMIRVHDPEYVNN